MLARTVGGDAVKVTVLSPPDRDAHYLLARPSMMVALRRADMLIAVGADLEVGWLPAAIQGASNPKIFPGQGGYFEGAAQVDLIEKGQAADRARGDVHPMGNPHYYMDPERMAEVARALAGRLGAMDPAHAAVFDANAEAFAAAVPKRVPRWKEEAAGAPGVVAYHKDINFIPPRVAFRFAHGWRHTLWWSMGLGTIAYLVSFVAAIRVDQPFGPVLLAVLLLMAPVRALARG